MSQPAHVLFADDLVVQMPTALLNSIEVPRYSVEAALLTLHHQGCHSAVVGALEGLRDYRLGPRCLAEFFIFHQMPRRLVELLETESDELLFYVIGLCHYRVPHLSGRIFEAQDLARSVRARRAAVEILEDLAIANAKPDRLE